ncbi:acetylxylan esterase [Promicromonospora citrea]|uniref:Acetylxylan esterase n=1 Tax=Promicromonospora citrea TaxID=43677 RepID=A0A8H9GIG9_9MICO|nr:acetylxylan esterase [Promicromonospora citrea]NNH52501.1 prolyl oligopeptidase family serine peptidase [Promicromonospora citrea]GGM30883.1 acetylxylan esterase [Promicromonospora citrea]
MAQFDLPLPDLERFSPEIDEPEDFDEFWSGTLAEARASGGAATLERVDTGFTQVLVDDVTFPGFGGHPVKAWLTRPAHAEGDLPVVVEYLGYGGGRGLPHNHLQWAAAGYAHLVMDTRGQGSGWGSGGATPDPVGSGPASPGFMTRGILDPREHYYRRVFTDGVRAVDAVRTIAGLDPERVAVTGVSQGGGITIAVAGLVPDVVAAMPDVPFLCHYRRAVSITDNLPYGEITRYLSVHRDPAVEAQVWRTLSYLDGVSFARRARTAGLFSTALMDTTCPPSTVYAAFNGWAAGQDGVVREIDVYPYNMHEGGGDYRFPRRLEWLGARL